MRGPIALAAAVEIVVCLIILASASVIVHGGVMP